MNLRLKVLIAVPVVVLISSCDSAFEPEGTDGRATLKEGMSQVPQVPFQTMDDVFARISERAPGFGGMFFDEEGRLIVNSTGTTSPDVVFAAITQVDGGSLYRRRNGEPGTPEVAFRSVDFDFSDLYGWAKLVSGLSNEEIVLVDVDERANRVRVRVTSTEARDGLLSIFQSSGIPEAALEWEVGSGPVPETSLGDRFRPIPRGVQVETSASRCTLMVNATTTGGDGFLTNSHCTQAFANGPDAGSAWQNTASSSNFVGIEVADPALFPCSESTAGCRYSDAAYFGYQSATLDQKGTIARPKALGSTEIGSTPRWLIASGHIGELMVGETVHRVGITEGWTSGQVTQTCVVVKPWADNTAMLCQWLADYGSNPGDSGVVLQSLSDKSRVPESYTSPPRQAAC